MFKNLTKTKIKEPFCVLLWFITLQKQATTTLYGYNLPALKLTANAPEEIPGPKRIPQSLAQGTKDEACQGRTAKR